jgi:hypothetical protein
MDVLGWLWWLFASCVALLWSVVWFLLGGWVSTLAQIAVIVLVVFGFKYGWRRAPAELMSRAAGFTRFAWSWMRSGGDQVRRTAEATSERSRSRRRSRRQPGDVRINVSTCMTLMMLFGLWLLAATL